jgi:hypothetical protein
MACLELAVSQPARLSNDEKRTDVSKAMILAAIGAKLLRRSVHP